MTDDRLSWSVFTKPWPSLTAAELGAHVVDMGFDGIELPIRSGFQVTPDRVQADLPRFAKELGDAGARILSVAGDPDEALLSACAEAGIPIVRIVARIGPDGYLDSERKARESLQALMPLCAALGVRIAVQPHYGRNIATSGGLRALLDGLPAELICAAWDAGHAGLTGEAPDLAIDQVESHLGLVNLKNGYFRKMTDENGQPAWTAIWTSGDAGMSDWREVARALTRTAFSGTICLTAQYSEGDVDTQSRRDLAYARELFREVSAQ